MLCSLTFPAVGGRHTKPNTIKAGKARASVYYSSSDTRTDSITLLVKQCEPAHVFLLAGVMYVWLSESQ